MLSMEKVGVNERVESIGIQRFCRHPKMSVSDSQSVLDLLLPHMIELVITFFRGCADAILFIGVRDGCLSLEFLSREADERKGYCRPPSPFQAFAF